MKLPSEHLPTEDEAKKPAEPIEAKRLFDLSRAAENGAECLLGDRYICRGGALLFVGPTGIGKSVLVRQACIAWSIGEPAFGIRPARPLRVLIVQAENDDGDEAEFRDGIIHGLNLTAQQIEMARERVLIHREDSRTNLRFFLEVIEPLLKAHKPDLLVIDPALAYLGGDTNSQKDVGAFLRNLLNPLLRQYQCACLIVHHTNKPPSGKEKAEWSATDFAYAGSGSAEWANWARGVLAVRSIGEQSVFELRAGKRGSRLGWLDDNGERTYTRLIGHSKESGFIYWRNADASEVNQGGRPKTHGAEDMLKLLPPSGLSSTEWQKLAKDECGISPRSFFRERKSLEASGRILKSEINGKWQPIKKR